MFKDFLMRKMLKSQLKGVPEADQEKLIGAIQKNPEFFKTIATEVQQKIKEGKSQMDAVMEVMKKHETELKNAMQ